MLSQSCSQKQMNHYGSTKMARVVIEEGDTVVIVDAAGVEYVLHGVFVSGQRVDHFEPECEDEILPVLDVTLSSFEFHIDSGNNEEVEE